MRRASVEADSHSERFQMKTTTTVVGKRVSVTHLGANRGVVSGVEPPRGCPWCSSGGTASRAGLRSCRATDTNRGHLRRGSSLVFSSTSARPAQIARRPPTPNCECACRLDGGMNFAVNGPPRRLGALQNAIRVHSDKLIPPTSPSPSNCLHGLFQNSTP